MKHKVNRKLLLGSLMFSFIGHSLSAQVSPSIKKNGTEPFWGQGKNNSNGCSPSFNYFCEKNTNSDADCDKSPAGCGPVAMGMIMYKYDWPYIKYNYYNWDVMGPELHEGDPFYIPRLLKDCGIAANTSYGNKIDGSWTYPSSFAGGMNTMKYRCYRYEEKDWKYGSAWTDLIKSELDAGRPIIVHGEDKSIFSSHYFVIDGYDSYGYSVNKGWKGGNSIINSLDDIKYKNDRSVYAGIYPIFPNMPDNRTSISLSGTLTELDAKSSIKNLNSSVTVGSGQTLVLVAGDKIELGPGISVKPGGNLKLVTRSDFKQTNKTISYTILDKYINRRCKRVSNGSVRVNVANADSWEAEIYNRDGKLIWRTAGSVKSSQIKIWDGSSVNNVVQNGQTYWVTLTLKNNTSRITETVPIAIVDNPCVVNYSLLNSYSGKNTTLMSPDCRDGVNDNLEYSTDGQKWIFELYDRWNKKIISRTGSVVNGKATLLTPSDVAKLSTGTYTYQVAFETSDGGHSEHQLSLLLTHQTCSLKSLRVGVDPVCPSSVENYSELVVVSESNDVEISPNPSSGTFLVVVGDDYCLNSYDVYVEDIKTGRLVYSETGLKEKNHTISLDNVASGVYIVKIDNGLNTTTKKLILK